MARYYLVSDYLVPVYSEGGGMLGRCNIDSHEELLDLCRSYGIKPSRNYCVLSIKPRLQVRAVFYAYILGLLMIKAPNRREAYSLATAIQAFFSVCFGYVPRVDRSTYFLNELNRVPQPSWTEEDLLNALREANPGLTRLALADLRSGVYIQHDQIQLLPEYVKVIYGDQHLNEAITHLNQSYVLFYGHMTDSYYHFHYRHERLSQSRSILEKRYLENRPRYEIAFLAAFKAIERFLRVNDVKKHEVERAFGRLPYSNISYDTEYTRWYEIFSGLPQKTTYGELVKHFLEIRNVVAAHANRKPPPRFMISEDSICEIQQFISELFFMALDSAVARA